VEPRAHIGIAGTGGEPLARLRRRRRAAGLLPRKAERSVLAEELESISRSLLTTWRRVSRVGLLGSEAALEFSRMTVARNPEPPEPEVRSLAVAGRMVAPLLVL
jgi:hypothetical protein